MVVAKDRFEMPIKNFPISEQFNSVIMQLGA